MYITTTIIAQLHRIIRFKKIEVTLSKVYIIKLKGKIRRLTILTRLIKYLIVNLEYAMRESFVRLVYLQTRTTAVIIQFKCKEATSSIAIGVVK